MATSRHRVRLTLRRGLIVLLLFTAACAAPDGTMPSLLATPAPNPESVTPQIAAAFVTPAQGANAPLFAVTPRPKTRPTATPKVSLGRTYIDPDGFFSLRYPKNWTQRRSGSEVQFLPDKSGETMLAISLQVKAVSARGMVDDIASFLGGKWQGYREVDRGEAELAGYESAWVEQSFEVAGEPYRGRLAGVVRNRVGFLILLYGPSERYAELESTFGAMVNTLKIVEFDEAPPYDDWLTRETKHFVFYYLPKSYAARAITRIAADHEAAFSDITDSLAVKYGGPIHFYLYPSAESFYYATARDAGFAIVEANEVHARWFSTRDHQSLGHEMTHVITGQAIGEPAEALLGEGIAVCLDHNTPAPHQRAADLLAAEQLVALSDLLGDAWFEQDPEVSYPQSGSFACWLLERGGVKPFKQIFVADDFSATAVRLYGANLNELEQAWLDMLAAY